MKESYPTKWLRYEARAAISESGTELSLQITAPLSLRRSSGQAPWPLHFRLPSEASAKAGAFRDFRGRKKSRSRGRCAYKTTAAAWIDRRSSDRLTEVEHTMFDARGGGDACRIPRQTEEVLGDLISLAAFTSRQLPMEPVLCRQLHGNYRCASVSDQIIPRGSAGFLAGMQLSDFERVAKAGISVFFDRGGLGDKDTLVDGNPPLRSCP